MMVTRLMGINQQSRVGLLTGQDSTLSLYSRPRPHIPPYNGLTLIENHFSADSVKSRIQNFEFCYFPNFHSQTKCEIDGIIEIQNFPF